jgi:ATP-dependent DNA helicase RecG
VNAGDSVTRMRGVGAGVAARLEKLGIRRIQDLLLHRPNRYEDRTRLWPLAALRPGSRALVLAQIDHVELRYGRRRSLIVSVSDASSRMTLRFFHFSDTQMQRMQTGAWIRAFGEVRAGPTSLEIVHPDYQVFDRRAEGEQLEPSLTPVYPVTKGVTQNRVRNLARAAVAELERPEFFPELLPGALLGGLPGIALAEALRTIHHPGPDDDLAALTEGRHPAVQRLALEELLAQQLGLRLRRNRAQAAPAPAVNPDSGLLAGFIRALGFEPTTAQHRVIDEILGDLRHDSPMLRLVQGDVGSGKTVVAAAAAAACVAAGYQAAFMAPTELLAEQHHRNLAQWLEPLGLRVRLLTGSLKTRERAPELEALGRGEAGLVVGTHALFQKQVSLPRLGLTIIDEQHRFGVHQRLALRDKAGDSAGAIPAMPHQLIMTATPIPRTLAMSAYADLDTSVIDELPPGRQPVTTVAISNARRAQVLERVAAACQAGRQAYWVCTLIEESEALQCQAAEVTAEMLATELSGLQVGLVHGRMDARAKTRGLTAFRDGRIDLLVATTVIEVGVDVPNASLMVIENAERLGLAQLHQLRGRVGRGAEQSHCVLLFQPPLGEVARARLEALRQSNDGFEIARRDLELRGPGEVLGTRQTGAMEFRVADLVRDADLLGAAQSGADRLLAEHPDRVDPLLDRWVHDAQRYADV